MYIPGVPVHVVQRGNNRKACFFSGSDYPYSRQLLTRYGAQLHAYCLMGNHVHRLITSDYEYSISHVIQHLGRQYVQCRTYQRSGTLWEGGHRGSLVDAVPCLLHCYRYVELNPVTARIVGAPDQYRWSSIITKLRTTAGKRECNYRDLVQSKMEAKTAQKISECVSAN